MDANRGSWGELPEVPAVVSTLVSRLDRNGGDEHGAWETAAAFNRRGHGQAINTDVYDYTLEPLLVLVQVRQYTRTKWGGSTRKDYYLCGINEGTHRPFAHPVGSAIVRANCGDTLGTAVAACERWIFGVTQREWEHGRRQGDVLLVPLRRLPSGCDVAQESRPVQVVDSHIMVADAYAEDVRGRMYAENPLLRHIKRQHRKLAYRGWHRICVGRRARIWDFGAPTAD